MSPFFGTQNWQGQGDLSHELSVQTVSNAIVQAPFLQVPFTCIKSVLVNPRSNPNPPDLLAVYARTKVVCSHFVLLLSSSETLFYWGFELDSEPLSLNAQDWGAPQGHQKWFRRFKRYLQAPPIGACSLEKYLFRFLHLIYMTGSHFFHFVSM